MANKPKKTREERIIEGYFPTGQDIKTRVEVKVRDAPTFKKEIAKTTIEKIYKKQEKELVEKIGKKIRKPYTKTKKTTKIIKEFSPQKIELREKGYELIITEKPQAALKISSALGRSSKKTNGKVPYYEVNRHGKQIIVACAVGHLFTLKQNTAGSNVPVFDIGWVPNFFAQKRDFTKQYYDTILKLTKQAGEITVATDFDIEGEVIGLNVVRFICGQKDANRMKFSTLTDKELENAYENKFKTINWGQAIAGETRHYLDWFYGINLSRALMNAIKTTGKFRIMSIGRVQGPALNLIVQKEKQIQEFTPQTYWQVFITLKNPKIELKYIKDIFKKKDLEKFKNLIGEKANAETKTAEKIIPPNPPFNLTTLQTEAYHLFGITPSQTLKIAQSLYLDGMISYPRTSSQKLPESIGYREILNKLSKRYHAENLIKRQKPVEGKKSDPAHPSIYPTGSEQILSGNEEKIYNLIVKRFLCLFCENAIVDNKTIKVTKDNLVFSTRGATTRKKAWMEIYPNKLKELELPDVNGEVIINKLRTEEKQTQPPKRYSPASIIAELEKRNLGTKSTRSSILETLYDRGYIKEKSIEATPMGISLISTLEKYSPIIIDEALTRNFEKQMEKIVESKNKFKEKEEVIIEQAKKTITDISKDFEKNEKKIGQELLKANVEQQEQQKIENKLCICPVCKKGNLAITYSRKTKRFFIACDAYPECKNTYSLPPNGVVKKTGKLCEKCGFPLLISLRTGKKPWVFCFNPECETNKERLEEYRKKQQENE